jgi:hypothetical protein
VIAAALVGAREVILCYEMKLEKIEAKMIRVTRNCLPETEYRREYQGKYFIRVWAAPKLQFLYCKLHCL